MPSLASDLRDLLKSVDATRPVTLGREAAPVPASGVDKARLERILDSHQRFNDRLLLVAVAMIVGVFLLSVFLTLHFKDNVANLTLALGGDALSILATVAWMRRLWIEKGLLDLARVASEQMSPEEALKFASSTYWHLLAQRRGRASLPGASRLDEGRPQNS